PTNSPPNFMNRSSQTGWSQASIRSAWCIGCVDTGAGYNPAQRNDLDFLRRTGEFFGRLDCSCTHPFQAPGLPRPPGRGAQVVADPREAPREVLGEEAFRHLLARETHRATRYQDFFSVCLVQADAAHVNPAEFQQAMARKIAEFLRSTDVVGQLEEAAAFLLLHTASSDAVRVAERGRANIENVAFPGPPGGPPRRITLSVGNVSFPRDGSNDKMLLTRALANLREAARLGGNRVVHAEDSRQ